jgi:hypothetical protein
VLLVRHISELCVLFDCVGEDLVIDGKGSEKVKQKFVPMYHER